jgi:hypothetical protein
MSRPPAFDLLTVQPVLNRNTDYAFSAHTSIAQYFTQHWIALVCI